MQAGYNSEIENAILRTLSYFDIFNYPLKASEILNFLTVKASKRDVDETLSKLIAERQVVHHGELYSLSPHFSDFERRLQGNRLADSLLPQVKQKADLIFRFPFVRAVMASGSFSKNFMDEKSDFDFFIICAPQRIWISRMLLVLYKKIVLKNSHRHFCVNYFIDESNLEIDEKNIFTATELATVLPLTGRKHYELLMSANRNWIMKAFPNYQLRMLPAESNQNGLLKVLLEKCLNVFFGDGLNRWFKGITLQRWKKTYAHLYAARDFDIAFKSTDSVSKNHPQNFQKRIVDEFNLRVNRLTNKEEVYE